MTSSLLSCIYIFDFLLFFFICSFFIIKQINSAFYFWKVKLLKGSSLNLGPAIWKWSSNYQTRFLFLSHLQAYFPLISCHCGLGAYIEDIISIHYFTACLLHEFHSNAGAWVFSKIFAVNGLISYPLLYWVFFQFIFYLNYLVFLSNCKFFICFTSLIRGKYKFTHLPNE